MGWKDDGDYLRIQLSPCYDTYQIWELKQGARKRGGYNKNIPIALNRDYWLRVVARQNGIDVLWSNDGKNFERAASPTDIRDPVGQVGLVTSGPNLPKTYFDDFDVAVPVSAH